MDTPLLNNEYLLVIPIQDMWLHDVFEMEQPLPLHCTVMPWFELGGDLTLYELNLELRRIAQGMKKRIELVSKEPALFGPNNDIPVHVLERTEELLGLHEKVLAYLRAHESLPYEEGYVGDGYRPHVTSTQYRHFPPGTTYPAQHLILIERDERSWRQVVGAEILSEDPPF